MLFPLGFAQFFFDQHPEGPGGGQVLCAAHRGQKRRAFGRFFGLEQRRQRVQTNGVLHRPALHAAAAVAQIPLIEGLFLLYVRQGSKQLRLAFVRCQQNVAALQRRVLPAVQPGQHLPGGQCLGRPHRGAAALRKIVLLQVHQAHQAPAHPAIGQGALQIDNAIHCPRQGLFRRFHGRFCCGQPLPGFHPLEQRVRHQQPHDAGGVLSPGLQLLPALPAQCASRGAGPLLGANGLAGQQQFTGAKAGLAHWPASTANTSPVRTPT